MILDRLLIVVCLGGGTGLCYLLKGLKHKILVPPILELIAAKCRISHLTAVVAVGDGGGSLGRLRKRER